MNLRPLLSPRSIAIVGASESPDSWAPEIFRSLQHLGYPGELYPVNPKYDEVWGRPCLSSVRELPKAGVDLAVIVIPASVASWSLPALAAPGREATSPTPASAPYASPLDAVRGQTLAQYLADHQAGNTRLH